MQRMLDYTDESILALEQALASKSTKAVTKVPAKKSAKPATKRKV